MSSSCITQLTVTCDVFKRFRCIIPIAGCQRRKIMTAGAMLRCYNLLQLAWSCSSTKATQRSSSPTYKWLAHFSTVVSRFGQYSFHTPLLNKWTSYLKFGGHLTLSKQTFLQEPDPYLDSDVKTTLFRTYLFLNWFFLLGNQAVRTFLCIYF